MFYSASPCFHLIIDPECSSILAHGDLKPSFRCLHIRSPRRLEEGIYFDNQISIF